MPDYPCLLENVTITPFETSSIEPLYLVHLPNGRKFQVSQDMAAALRLLNGRNSPENLAQQLSIQMRRTVTEQEVDWLINEKLAPLGILAALDNQARATPSKPNREALALRFKVPLLSEKVLRPFTSLGQYLFAKPVLICLLLLSVGVHIPIYWQLQNTLSASIPLMAQSYTSPVILVVLGLSVFVHELGHLSACHRYGARYGKLGVGIYLFHPVAYVDVTDSWRLPRWQRVTIDLGGMYFELILCGLLYGLYLYTHDPAFLLAVFVVDSKFIPNLNPMFKYDGYWALSDIIGTPNLHKRVADFWRQWPPRSGKKQSGAFLRTQPYTRLALGAYALAVTIYAGYFLLMMFWFLPPVIRAYPNLVLNAWAQTWREIQMGNLMSAGNGFIQILFASVLPIGLFSLIWGFIPALGKISKNALAWLQQQRLRYAGSEGLKCEKPKSD